METYIVQEVSELAYDISCPDPTCERQGVLQLHELEFIAGLIEDARKQIAKDLKPMSALMWKLKL